MKPYTFGDVCKYTGREALWAGEHIIKECSMDSPEIFEYATTQGAWIDHNDLELVEESSKQSRQRLWDEMEGECLL